MRKIFEFIESISGVYAVFYVIILHIIAIFLIGIDEIDFTQPKVDIVLEYIIIILGFAICDFCFFIPSIALIAFGTIISFFMTISISLFLFLATCEVLGSEIINVLNYGFIKTLIGCIIVTPFGFMNLISLKILGF